MEARARNAANEAATMRERARQNEMNRAAYAMCAPLWTRLLAQAAADAAAMEPAARILAKRVANRAELRLATLSADEAKRLPPGSFVAMGTSGLKPIEVPRLPRATLRGSMRQVDGPCLPNVCLMSA